MLNNERKYEIKLKVFEGPMDLLVYLIQKNEVDIYDIPIADITEQFMAYMELMKLMNLDFAGEFLLMAATLMRIKSKMLLPVHDGDHEDVEDPRNAITGPLMEYLKMKSAADKLGQREILGDSVFVRTPDQEEFGAEADAAPMNIGLFELIDAFRSILDNFDGSESFELTAESISIKDKISRIMEILESCGSRTFGELFDLKKGVSDLIITFLAILEMVKLNLISVVQHAESGIIRVLSVCGTEPMRIPLHPRRNQDLQD